MFLLREALSKIGRHGCGLKAGKQFRSTMNLSFVPALTEPAIVSESKLSVVAGVRLEGESLVL